MKNLSIYSLFVFFICLSSTSHINAQTLGWGDNSNGALGIGTSGIEATPQTVNALPDATGGSGGIDHTLFLLPNGTLAVAGLNDFGQFGDNLQVSGSSSPIAVTGLTNVVRASSGGFFSTALLSDGTVWSWGYNAEGEIGNGTTSTTDCSCLPTPAQTAISNVVQIEAGSFHTLALKSDGTVWAWGHNSNGQIGDGTTTDRPTPLQVGVGVVGFSNIIAISAGDDHSTALKSDGTVWIWGSNEYGQIGNGTVSMTNQLTPALNTTLSNITQISAGIYQNIALNSSGRVFTWGDNFYGQTGNGTTGAAQPTPLQNATLTGVVELETSGFTNFVRLRDGTIYAWGLNDAGEIGNGTINLSGCQCQPTPVQTSVGAGSTGIAAGWFHALSLKPVISAVTGSNQTFRGDNLRLTFADITNAGNISYAAVTAAAVTGSYSVPLGYTVQANQPGYDVTTTATATGNIDVCIAGINEYNPTVFANLRILHGEGVALVDRTFSTSFINREICARVSSLSPFVIATAPGATAANVSVAGKVMTGKSGISRVIVTVTDAAGTIRTAKTNTFGYYRFEVLPAGQTYIFNASAKGYSFAPQVLTLNDSVENLDFAATE